MGARERILQRIGAALGREAPASGEALAQERLKMLGHAPPPRPQWQEPAADRLLERHAAAAGTAARAAHGEEVVRAVAAYLRQHELGTQLRAAAHPWLAALPWAPEVTIQTEGDPASARVALSVADAGVAETGSLVIACGPAAPSALNLLPEHHLVLLRSGDIVGCMEDVWARLRVRPSFPPRAVHFITGPSRTADVEQTIQLGAHGPRSLHLILYEGPDVA